MTLKQLKEEIGKWNNPAMLSHDELFDLVNKARELGRIETLQKLKEPTPNPMPEKYETSL